MPEVRGIDAVMIYASDPARLAEWYATTLGIRTRLDPRDGNRYGDVGGVPGGRVVHFGIYPAGSQRPGVMVNYRVDDFDGFVAALRERGIAIKRVVEEAYGRFVYFDDPDGNTVEVWSEGPRPGPGP
jgi:catechol 2,3-dioxygenase-like lactoylglutathione lyase family enzyme